MRLINADELQGLARTVVGQDNRTHSAYFKTTIDNAPTVKAIPIEWIEKWVDMLKERNYHSYQILMPALIEMLEAWGKENEELV